jgi:hypothetical protein
MSKSRIWLALGLMCAAAAAPPASANLLAEDPLPRVEDALCPGVAGMATDSALQVLDRVRSNAASLGIGLADPDTCAPNLVIAFVNDGGNYLDTLMESQPRLFETLTLAEKRALQDSTGPVRAWNVVVTRTRDGMVVTQQENMTQIPQAAMWSAHSKIYTATRQDIVSTVVLFDNRQATGMTTTQLADYASMRGFAADFTAHAEGPETILSLFDGAAGRPAELTQADLKFLQTLYSGIPNLPGRAKIRSMEQELGG